VVKTTSCQATFAQLLYPLAGHIVVAGDLALAASFQHDGGDDELRFRHGRQDIGIVPNLH